jgi:hypothetical protein
VFLVKQLDVSRDPGGSHCQTTISFRLSGGKGTNCGYMIGSTKEIMSESAYITDTQHTSYEGQSCVPWRPRLFKPISPHARHSRELLDHCFAVIFRIDFVSSGETRGGGTKRTAIMFLDRVFDDKLGIVNLPAPARPDRIRM